MPPVTKTLNQKTNFKIGDVLNLDSSDSISKAGHYIYCKGNIATIVNKHFCDVNNECMWMLFVENELFFYYESELQLIAKKINS